MTEQKALEEEALGFLLENEEREKKELQQALKLKKNRGKAFHEVYLITLYIHSHLNMTIFHLRWVRGRNVAR